MLAALWVTALATVVLTAVGLATAFSAFVAYRNQSAQLAEQRAANKKQAQLIDLQLRAQARRVLVWQEQEVIRLKIFGTTSGSSTPKPQPRAVVHVRNTSETSIHDVTFYWYDGQERTGDSETTGSLLPDADARADKPDPSTHDYKALVSFRDADGVTWAARSDKGQFEPVAPKLMPPDKWPTELSELANITPSDDKAPSK